MGAANSVVPTQGCCSTGIFGAKNYTPYMTDSESDSWTEYESPKPRKKSRKKKKKKKKKKKSKKKKHKHKHKPGKVRKVKTDPMHINTEKRHKIYTGHYHTPSLDPELFKVMNIAFAQNQDNDIPRITNQLSNDLYRTPLPPDALKNRSNNNNNTSHARARSSKILTKIDINNTNNITYVTRKSKSGNNEFNESIAIQKGRQRRLSKDDLLTDSFIKSTKLRYGVGTPVGTVKHHSSDDSNDESTSEASDLPAAHEMAEIKAAQKQLGIRQSKEIMDDDMDDMDDTDHIGNSGGTGSGGTGSGNTLNIKQESGETSATNDEIDDHTANDDDDEVGLKRELFRDKSRMNWTGDDIALQEQQYANEIKRLHEEHVNYEANLMGQQLNVLKKRHNSMGNIEVNPGKRASFLSVPGLPSLPQKNQFN